MELPSLPDQPSRHELTPGHACHFTHEPGKPGATGDAIVMVPGVLSDGPHMVMALADEMRAQLDPRQMTFVDYLDPLQSDEAIAAQITDEVIKQLHTAPHDDEHQPSVHVIGASFGGRMLPAIMHELQQRELDDTAGHVSFTLYDPAVDPEDIRVTREGAKLEQLTGITAVDELAKHGARWLAEREYPKGNASTIGAVAIRLLGRPVATGHTSTDEQLTATERVWANLERFSAELPMMCTATRSVGKWIAQCRALLNQRVPLEDCADGRSGELSWTFAAVTNDHNNQIVPGREWLGAFVAARRDDVDAFAVTHPDEPIPTEVAWPIVSARTPHCAFFAYGHESVAALAEATRIHEEKRRFMAAA